MSKFFFAELQTDKTGKTEEWCKSQLYIALGNALHTLSRLKIDSTTMEGIDVEKVNSEFSEELGTYKCNFALSLGYRVDDDFNAKLAKSRLHINDIIYKI